MLLVGLLVLSVSTAVFADPISAVDDDKTNTVVSVKL